jgi:hypothetical protein
MAQFHLIETEPAPENSEVLIQIQRRRRVFWCSYAIDRAVCSSYDFPFSIPDHHITVPASQQQCGRHIIVTNNRQFFGNIDDDQLQNCQSVPHSTLQFLESSSLTSVSSALHVLRSRRIESEIQETLLSKDFVANSDRAFSWRAQIMHKLNIWNQQSEKLSDPSRKGYVSENWLKMIYYYNVIMLYRPVRTIARGLTGDLCVQGCCQALLMFRKFQMAREIAQPWLGVSRRIRPHYAMHCSLTDHPASDPVPNWSDPSILLLRHADVPVESIL